MSGKVKTATEQKIIFKSYGKMENGEFKFINPNEITRPKCGEIWKCDLGDNEGSVQSGYRPVFVISNNRNNKYSPTINVFPLTSKMNKKNLPVHVELWDYKKYGLAEPSTITVEQPMTIPLSRFSHRIGTIDDLEVLQQICMAMEIQFPLIRFKK